MNFMNYLLSKLKYTSICGIIVIASIAQPAKAEAAKPKNYLFIDMGGVLIKTSKLKAMNYLGAKCMAFPNLKERFFEFMNSIDLQNKIKPDGARFQGSHLPSFLCKWQKGLMSSKEVSDYIVNAVDSNTSFKFKNKTEKALIRKSAELLLPKNNLLVTQLRKSMIELIVKCKNKKDKNGDPVNILFLTSNCDVQTYDLLKKEYPEIFEAFDEDKIIISGAIKAIKPHKDFYDYVLKKYALDPKKHKITLIDDQQENLKGAQACGINGILHKDTAKTFRLLKQMGAA